MLSLCFLAPMGTFSFLANEITEPLWPVWAYASAYFFVSGFDFGTPDDALRRVRIKSGADMGYLLSRGLSPSATVLRRIGLIALLALIGMAMVAVALRAFGRIGPNETLAVLTSSGPDQGICAAPQATPWRVANLLWLSWLMFVLGLTNALGLVPVFSARPRLSTLVRWLCFLMWPAFLRFVAVGRGWLRVPGEAGFQHSLGWAFVVYEHRVAMSLLIIGLTGGLLAASVSLWRRPSLA